MLIETLLIAGLISLLLAFVIAFILIRIQQRHMERFQAQQYAWQRAQEMHQQQWQVQQEKRANNQEDHVENALDQVRNEWQEWQTRDAERVEQLAHQYETAAIRSYIEHELARLPRVEDIPLLTGEERLASYAPMDWQPPQLRGANLARRDLSHRYLVGANLRNANLAHANLFMADLSGACLAGANLVGADLSGANLTGADMHNATLVETNLLVTDLNDADFRGANLLGAHNLTRAQLSSVSYDGATLFDLEIDVTLPRLTRLTIREEHPPIPTPSAPQTPYEIPIAAHSLKPTVTETPVPSADEPTLLAHETPIPATDETAVANNETPSSLSALVSSQELSPASDRDALTTSLLGPEDDSLLDAQEIHLLADNTESTHTALPDKETPNHKHNGRKRARVN